MVGLLIYFIKYLYSLIVFEDEDSEDIERKRSMPQKMKNTSLLDESEF